MTSNLPTNCPSCSSELTWDKNKVHLVCKNSENCDDQRLQKIVSFLKILGVDGVGEGVVEQLYSNGYTSIPQIVHADESKLQLLDGFGKRKANIVCENIKSKLVNVPLEKVQHASGFFKGLGSKKLLLLNSFDSPDNIAMKTVIECVDGFSSTSADSYLNGINKFWEFMKLIPEITIAKLKEATGTKCDGMIFCFTGFRDKDAQATIEDLGGKIGSSVSGKTTHVVTKDKDSSSSKIKKARDLGITVWEPADLFNFLKQS